MLLWEQTTSDKNHSYIYLASGKPVDSPRQHDDEIPCTSFHANMTVRFSPFVEESTGRDPPRMLIHAFVDDYVITVETHCLLLSFLADHCLADSYFYSLFPLVNKTSRLKSL